MKKITFSKKKILVLCASLTFLSIAWVVLFNYATQNLTIKIEQAISDLKNKGYVLSYKKISLSGNPLQAKIKIDSPHLQTPLHGYEWKGHQIVFSVYFWNLKSIYATLNGEHVITTPSSLFPNAATFHLNTGKINLILNQQTKLAGVRFTTPELTISSLPQQNLIKKIDVSLSQLDKPFFYKLNASIEIMNIKNLLNSSLTSSPLKLSTEMEMGGLQDNKPYPHTYADWRDAGGILDINSLSLDWSPILVTANGSLTLDQSMRLLASFAAEIHGYEEVLNILVASGKIKKKHAKRASFVFQLFSSTDEAGNSYIKIPITLQNGILSTGPVNLLKLPSLENKVIN